MLEKPDRSSFTTLDFLGWDQTGTLSLSPKFQRREVWSTSAQTYFIDTLLKGYPVPPLYLRKTQNPDKTKIIRDVIDGQQRLRAVLGYVKGRFPLAKSVSDEAPNLRFDQLSEDQQDRIRNYSFTCETFSSISDEEVLEVFARINTRSVKLNAQELRNGRFFGEFKRAAYRLAHEHLPFWRDNRIFTEGRIARMAEVELVSELLIVELDGLQDKKSSIDSFYAGDRGQTPNRNVVNKRLTSPCSESGIRLVVGRRKFEISEIRGLVRGFVPAASRSSVRADRRFPPPSQPPNTQETSHLASHGPRKRARYP